MEKNILQNQLILIKLVDGTKVFGKKFQFEADNVIVEDIKYIGEDSPPVYLNDKMTINCDAIDVWFTVHEGGKNGKKD